MNISKTQLRRSLLAPPKPRWWDKFTWRWECAIALWVWAIGILVSNSDFSPFTWEEWLLVGWISLKVALLICSGVLLIVANEEVKRLQQNKEDLLQLFAQMERER